MIYLYFVTALVPAVFIYDGLREGAVHTRAWAVRRSEDPVQFWAIMAMYGGLFLWLAYLGVTSLTSA